MLRSLVLAAVALGALSIACGDDSGNPNAVQPTYTDISAKIFMPSCATGGCHNTASKAGGLDLSKDQALANLVGVKVQSPEWASTPFKDFNRVTAGNPDQSGLVITLQQPSDLPVVLHMPSGAKLPQERIDAIRTWIANGAKND